MTRRSRKKHAHSPTQIEKSPATGEASPHLRSTVAGRKVWWFRIVALLAGPACLLALLELILRLAGFGYPTSFLLPGNRDGSKVFVQNNKFGWRFFGPRLARLPYPLSIPNPKPAGTVRIYVLGESAARGDPQPQFGLPRMLQAVLSLRYPGVRFEVENAAMTAINSHTVLPIARDCARAGSDYWVIYTGNNEVVGPFGAGTVFGPQVPPLPLIRAALALKTTRLGQLLDTGWGWIRRRTKPAEKEWHGMKMFMGQQVRPYDRRLKPVYRNFERNLAEVLEAGRRHGVGIVVSTVAVNLKDCAPFASAHRTSLSGPEELKWEQLYQAGVSAQESGKNRDAAGWFDAAAQIDDSFAALRFRQAQCLLALGKVPEAQIDFRAARDLDTLRFRCDNRLNEIIRRLASGRAPEHILPVDAEQTFAEHSPDGVPGQNFFYEHVHPNFEGNYLLTRTIAAQLEKLLPESVAKRRMPGSSWPSAADCARRLAWDDLSRLSALKAMLARILEPPFINQLNHDQQVQGLISSMRTLAPTTRPTAIDEARKSCEAAIAAAPDDPVLYAQLASRKQAMGDLAGAAAALRRSVELLPTDLDAWYDLGMVQTQQRQFENAAAAFQQACDLDPQEVRFVLNLAQTWAALGSTNNAIREYRRALLIRPDSGLAWLCLGLFFEQMGRSSEAEDCYRKALTTGDRGSGAATLARFCQSRGWLEAASTNYTEALREDPLDPTLHMETGQIQMALKHYAAAQEQFVEAVRLEPELPRAHVLYGAALAQVGKTPDAVEQFREALRLEPDLKEAHLSLGIVLMNQGDDREALRQFDGILERYPADPKALPLARALRARIEGLPKP